MLLSTLVAVLSLAVSPSLASPTLEKRATACAWNSVTTVASFTMLAVNKDNMNIQRPLALGVIDGYQPGVTVLGTAKSLGTKYGRNFTMTAGAITSVAPKGQTDVQLSMYVPFNDGLLEFMSKKSSATGRAIAAYCELFNTSPHGVPFPYEIAVNGDSDNFYLCESKKPRAEIVVYMPANGTALPYISSTCEAVDVHAIHDCC